MKLIGIDPGKSGGIVTITRSEGDIFDLRVMPDYPQDIISYFEEVLACEDKMPHVFLEKAQAMPKNGAVSMFNYGVGFGILQGILLSLKIPHTQVTPSSWTKSLHLGATNSDPKKKSLEVARRLYPNQTFRDPESKLARKPHSGIIDALLIAEFGRRTLGAR